jgi:hypothetical protein
MGVRSFESFDIIGLYGLLSASLGGKIPFVKAFIPHAFPRKPFYPIISPYMKCPECDLEQPDSTAICAGCGLSFEMWRQHNPDADLSSTAVPKEMAFAESEEASAKAGSKTEEVSTPEKEQTAPETSGQEKKAKSTEPGESSAQDKPGDGNRTGLKLTPVHFGAIGGGLFVILILVVLIHRHRTPHAAYNPGAVTPASTVLSTPASLSTPGNPTPMTPPAAIAPANSPAPTPASALPAAIPTTLPPTAVPTPVAPVDTPTVVPAAAAPVVDNATPTSTPNPDFWK